MSDCVLWTKARTGKYGQLTWHQEHWLAHRFSWFQSFGPIPKGLHVLHRCDTPLCVNPEHLFLGTNADNMRDKIAKGRNHKGEGSGTAKLTEDDVYSIIASYPTCTIRELADDFCVSYPTVRDILKGQTWKHVTGL